MLSRIAHKANSDKTICMLCNTSVVESLCRIFAVGANFLSAIEPIFPNGALWVAIDKGALSLHIYFEQLGTFIFTLTSISNAIVSFSQVLIFANASIECQTDPAEYKYEANREPTILVLEDFLAKWRMITS